MIGTHTRSSRAAAWTAWYAIAYQITRDADRADDAVQQALVAMWRDLPSLRDASRFDGWTYRLVARASLQDLRQRRRANVLPPRVLVFGNYLTYPGGCETGVEPVLSPWLGVYNPETGITLETRNPTTGIGSLSVEVSRQYESGALLPDGRVALIADDSDNPTPNAVDIFTPGR